MAVTVQMQFTSAVTELYQDAFVGSAMENGTTIIQFDLRQHDFHDELGTEATICWRKESYHVDVHELSTFHNPITYRFIVAQGSYVHDNDQRMYFTPTIKGVSTSQHMSHSVIRLACDLAVVCGVSLRHIALLFSALFLIPMTKSSIKRWMDDIGTHSVGVKRQWCSHRGKVDNCQVGVYMGYVSRHDHALLDFRLSLPEEWARDEQRRQECHVPEAVSYRTRHEQCLEMLDLWCEQVPHGWVTGDDELGRHTRFRQALRQRGERYVLGVPCNTIIRDLEAPLPAYQGRGRRPKAPWHSVSAWRHALDPDGWTRWTVRDGEKGPVEIEMVTRRVQTRLERKRTGPHEWLVVTRRPLADEGAFARKASPDARDQDARYGYRYYLTPTGRAKEDLEEPSLMELARVIKAGSCIEASFQRGKGEAGMDAYQVRTWEGWHHHMALTLIAVWFLISETHRGQQWTPALTLPQVRYGLSVLLLETFLTLGGSSICRQVQRQLMRNELARFYHHRTRKCLPPRKLRRDIQ